MIYSIAEHVDLIHGFSFGLLPQALKVLEAGLLGAENKAQLLPPHSSSDSGLTSQASSWWHSWATLRMLTLHLTLAAEGRAVCLGRRVALGRRHDLSSEVRQTH